MSDNYDRDWLTTFIKPKVWGRKPRISNQRVLITYDQYMDIESLKNKISNISRYDDIQISHIVDNSKIITYVAIDFGIVVSLIFGPMGMSAV